jgi:PAS domain S-box-containing protein
VTNRDSSPTIPLNGVQNLGSWKDERRRRPPRRSSAEVLAGLPAQLLLNRLDTATIVIGVDGFVVYANPACERMLGYHTASTLEGLSLAALLSRESGSTPRDCVELLRDQDTVTYWNHSDGYPIATLASDPMLLHATDPILMVTLIDVSDRVWSEVDRAYRFSAQRGE